MRHLAALMAAAFVVALVAPAILAQQYGDVPTNHWAYDAIARLAAKGIIQGYPDQTFKGDRAMTRYEMAMVVARLLARIESIQVPAAPAPAPSNAPPPITRVDMETIQRLVNEFRAELDALGVRTAAIEEELNALKAKIGNVQFSGNLRFRYEDYRSGSGPSINGGNTFSTDSSTNPAYPRAREAFKLNFDGSVSPDLHLIGAIVTCPQSLGATASACIDYLTFSSSLNGQLADIDSLFLDYARAFGLPLELWLGRWGCTRVGACYATQFGPFGLLMNSTGDTWEDATLSSGNNVADGLMGRLSWPSLWDLKVQAAIIRLGGLGGFAGPDDNVYGLDINGQVVAGLRVGANYVLNNLYGAYNPTINYGPAGGGSVNAPGSRCTGFGAGGITCDTAGNGYGAYIQYDVAPIIHLDGEWATWNDTGPTPGSDNGYQVNVHWDLGALTGLGHNFSLDTGYLNFGQNFYPLTGAAEADIAMNDNLYPGNANGFVFNASYDFAEAWTLHGIVFTGHTASNGQALLEYEAGVAHKFAPSSTLTLLIRDEKIANIDQLLIYRAQVDYNF